MIENHEAQQVQQTQEDLTQEQIAWQAHKMRLANTVPATERRLYDAIARVEKYYGENLFDMYLSLMARRAMKESIQKAIDKKATPEELLKLAIRWICGSESPQTEAVAQIIDEDRKKDGYQLVIDYIKQRREELNSLNSKMEAVKDELAALEKAKRKLTAHEKVMEEAFSLISKEELTTCNKQQDTDTNGTQD